MPRNEAREVLVLRGRLDRGAGQFWPRRMRSTPVVRQWPVVEASATEMPEVWAELLDDDEHVVHRERAKVSRLVDCAPGDPQQYDVTAYIGLRPDAATVRLVRGDLLLWREPIAEEAGLEVALGRVTPRKRGATLSVRFSDPANERPHLTVIYQWGEGRFETIYLGPPQERLDLDLTEWPGGERCRFLATYSNGMRSAQAVAEWFELPPLGPSLTITRPGPDDQVIAGLPVTLEGGVVDRERRGGARPEEELWWSIDGEAVARGPLTSVDELAEGAHLLELEYWPESAKEPAARVAVEVRAVPAQAPQAGDWPEWDPLV